MTIDWKRFSPERFAEIQARYEAGQETREDTGDLIEAVGGLIGSSRVLMQIAADAVGGDEERVWAEYRERGNSLIAHFNKEPT